MENNDQMILPVLEEETFWVIGTHDNNYNKKSWQDQAKIFLLVPVRISYCSRYHVCQSLKRFPLLARPESLGRYFPQSHQLFSRKYAVK